MDIKKVIICTILQAINVEKLWIFSIHQVNF